jgi:hypothetical protein
MMTSVIAIASGGSTQNAGIFNTSSSPVMANVTATATGSVSFGVDNYLSSPIMMNVIATASGGTNNYGVWNDSSYPTIQNSTISASGGTNDGLHNISSDGNNYTIMINNSQITGNTSTIYQDSHYTTKIGASQLIGSGVQGSGTYICAVSYNGNYTPLNSTCH